MTASRSPRPSGRHHGDLPAALERAASELVLERGVHGFTLAEASRRAGVSVSAPFKHYDGREGLLAALAARSFAAQAKAFDAALAGVADPVEALAAFSEAYVRFAVGNRALFEVAYGHGLDKRQHPALERAGSRVLDVLREPARTITRDDASALTLLHAVAAIARGYAEFVHEGVFGRPTARRITTVVAQVRDAATVVAEAARR